MKFNSLQYIIQLVCILGGLLAGYVFGIVTDAQGGERSSILFNGVLIGALLALSIQLLALRKKEKEFDQEQDPET